MEEGGTKVRVEVDRARGSEREGERGGEGVQ
jgi:hypothetical protein